ncbi:MAG: TlyA family RNA methyltransferase [Oscillospiraceae bacterium]|nr:TlyA family RNA methyltransferase [Oscillospiraceae bacterium]
MNAKQRLDTLLFERGLCPSRERARTTIMSGRVYVEGHKEEKPGLAVRADAAVEVRGDPIGFVSRGGLKLDKALSVFQIDAAGALALDAGASTGGFTDCLLRRGAARVWAVDVGYGQLDWGLRRDERVVVMERTNIRYVTPEQIGAALDIAVMDLSFISLKLVLEPVARLLKPDGRAVCLVKPQFEAGRDKVGKKGVVRDPAVHQTVLADFLEAAARCGYTAHGLSHSPVKGPEGNIEYLACLARGAPPPAGPGISPEAAVTAAHAELNNTPVEVVR